ncbi:putative uncharacterized protein [Burkholderiales bacterium GJ-E10]|nr:putative uncharacterized protein [Burkholderiales bacterium GJ-E10]
MIYRVISFPEAGELLALYYQPDACTCQETVISMRKIAIAVISAAAAASSSAWAWHSHTSAGVDDVQGAYGVVFPPSAARPDPLRTPGAVDPRVTQDNLRETICRRGGYTRSVRPSMKYTERLKRRQIEEYGYGDHRMRDYEEDHLVSLELGGAPADPRNLWPEPHHVIGGWGSYAKDKLENRLHTLVCHHRIPLTEAQSEIASDWIAAYRRYIGPTPDQSRRHRSGD